MQTSKVQVCAKSLQSCHPMDCSPPDSSAHGILQTRMLEWVAVLSSRESTGSSILFPRTYGGLFDFSIIILFIFSHLLYVLFSMCISLQTFKKETKSFGGKKISAVLS